MRGTNRPMILSLALIAVGVTGLAAVGAQEPPAAPATAPDAPAAATPTAAAGGSSAQAEAGEPRADTSAAADGTGEAATSAPAAGSPGGGGAAGSPPVAPRASEHTARAAPDGKGAKPTSAADRLELGVATVTGDREQPKVMYVVPWKRSDIGDLSGKPMNSLLDEALAPVDREEFRREVMYYNVVKADAAQNGAAAKAEK